MFLIRAIVFLSCFLFAVPDVAAAALTDPKLVPDGTYVVVVEKVVDNAHIVVKMDNGIEAQFPADGVDFSGLSANEKLKISVVEGKIPVYRPA